MSETGQALFSGATPSRVLNFDSEAGILYLLPHETNICPHCRATEGQSWECGEPEFYEMSCGVCRELYCVAHVEGPA
jgi:hypothetical protein